MDVNLNGLSVTSLRISSLDEEEDGDEIHKDDVEDEFSDEEVVPMLLGFAEKPENPWSLLRQYFPCKAGGTPAWLDPKNLPTGKSIFCDFCQEPLQFVLQVYIPLTEESTFHRTLYIFMCLSMACLLRDQHEQWKRHPEVQSRSVKVFRCQLPRVNPFYSIEPPTKDGSQLPLTTGVPLCNWCGTWKGEKLCGNCRSVRYCSGKHQAAHWRSGNASHKMSCQQIETTNKESKSKIGNIAASNTLWPEYEITVVDEKDDDEVSNGNVGSSSALVSSSRTDGSYKEWMTSFMGTAESRSWASFQERISKAPSQILRCSDSGQAKPLWPVSSGRPTIHDIPKCNNCGAARVFELQVLPQLLYFFHVNDTEDSLDWATVAVYSCEASCDRGMAYKEESCDRGMAYKEEFAWVQLSS